jgi:hypothetical protein
MAGRWVNGTCVPYTKENPKVTTYEKDEDDPVLVQMAKDELEAVLALPMPTDPTKAIQRTKKCADLLQTITNSQTSSGMSTPDVVRVLHESFFAIAYKQGVEEGKRQTQQQSHNCEICAERRRRNREAAAQARKRIKLEKGEDDSDVSS